MNTIKILYLAIILIGVAARLVPHPPNFTPTGAIAFFSGSKLRSALGAYAVPLLILAASDLVLGWHKTLPFVYAGFIASVALGRALRGSALKQIAGLSLSSVIFFILSNFGVWAVSGMYDPSAAGLAACYIAAIPFFANELAANLIYGGAFFAVAALVEKKISVFETAA